MNAAEPRTVLSRFTVLAVADLASKGVGFAWTLAIIHYYGSSGLGATMFAASVVAYALFLGSWGTDIYAVREVASGRIALGSMIRTLLWLRLLLGGAVYALLLIVALAVPPLRAHFGLIALFGLSLFTGAVATNWVPQAIQKTRVLAAANFVIQAAIWAFIVIMSRRGCGLWNVPVAQVAAEGLVGVALLGWSLRQAGGDRQRLPYREWAGILRQSSPIGLGQVLRTLALGSDILILAFFMPMAQVGWYGGANKLFLVGTALIGMYNIILFPRMAKTAIEGPTALRHMTVASIRYIVPLATAAVLVTMLAAKPLLRILFSDPTFTAAAPALRLLLATLVVNLLSLHMKSILLVRGRQRTDLHLTALASAGHVVFKLTLIPLLGMTGAALGTLLGEALYLVAGFRATQAAVRGDP